MSRFESADAGDFEKDHAFSYSAWIMVPGRKTTGAVLARMDTAGGHRGWDLWLEGNRVATHILHNWPDDALKVVSRAEVPPNAWTHVLATYDGSGKAAGVKIYIDGRPEATDVAADALRNTIRTPAPFTLGQRHTGEGADGAAILGLRLYDRTLTPPEVDRLACSCRDRVASLKPRPRQPSSPALGSSAATPWVVAAVEVVPGQPSRAHLGWRPSRRTSRPSKARAPSRIAMLRAVELAMAFLLNLGRIRQARDPGQGEHAPKTCRRCRLTCPRARWALATWLVRPRHP